MNIIKHLEQPGNDSRSGDLYWGQKIWIGIPFNNYGNNYFKALEISI